MNSGDLLRPTLSEYRAAPALYNQTGFFLAAFFGGPLGAGVYGAANSFRLGRLGKDLPLILALVAAAYLLIFEMDRYGWLEQVAASLGSSIDAGYRIIVRALGLACAGAIYYMHRRFFRAAKVASVTPLPGWVPGITGFVLGLLANVAFAGWILEHH